MERIKREIKEYIEKHGKTHILIHSDILYGFKITFENRNQVLSQTYKELENICQPLDIIMPSFNYDFCKGKPFNLKEDISQVGTLSEYFRQEIASWRSSTPVFSFSGTGVMPQQELGSVIDPFDDTSLFGFLNKNNGLLMHYGSAFQATTLIHYAERISGNLIYRYNKKFNGLICDAKNYEVTLNYHVIPKNVSLVYDWAKLERHLLEKKILLKLKEGRTKILLARIDEIVSFWLEKLTDDPFYFLDSETKSWVLPKYQELNRRFIISDFE